MKSAIRLADLIEEVKRRLEAEKVDWKDYDASIECLSKCVGADDLIEIYEQYINY